MLYRRILAQACVKKWKTLRGMSSPEGKGAHRRSAEDTSSARWAPRRRECRGAGSAWFEESKLPFGNAIEIRRGHSGSDGGHCACSPNLLNFAVKCLDLSWPARLATASHPRGLVWPKPIFVAREPRPTWKRA